MRIFTGLVRGKDNYIELIRNIILMIGPFNQFTEVIDDISSAGPGMCEAVSIIHSLALGGHKHSKHKPTNKKANQSSSDLGAQLMRLSHGNSPDMAPSYLDTKVKSSC